jgi:hypothetical protein
MITRYVNTASTAGGDGTTNLTAGATRAFATLREALDALPGTLTDQTTIYCEGAAADTGDTDQTPWDFITSPTNYLLITTVGAQRHQGVWNTGIYRLTQTNNNGLYFNSSAHVRLDGLQVQITINNGSSFVGIKLGNSNMTASNIDCRATNCLVKAIETSGSITGFNDRPFDAATGAGNTVFINCVAIDCNQGYNTDRLGARFYNCGAYDCNYGFVDDGGTAIAKNCIAYSTTNQGFVGTFGGTGTSNNAEDDGNGVPGTGGFSGTTFTLVNAAGDDFHLAEADIGARARGVNLSADATYPFSIDIDDQTRTGTWDIGPDQFVVETEAVVNVPGRRIYILP